MWKYILVFCLAFGVASSQGNKGILKQILNNNKDIKAYSEYLASIGLESRTNTLPLNPKVDYSFLSGSGAGNKQELVVSQSFEFPTAYFIKSDIADLQYTVNDLLLKEYKKSILKTSSGLLIDYTGKRKKVEELAKRTELAENMLKAVQLKFDKAEVGILELNKTKSSLALAKSKLNIAKIDLNSVLSRLVVLNGGVAIIPENIDYFQREDVSDFEMLFNKLKESNFTLKSLEEEKKLFDKKLSLAKTTRLPSFDVGYRQESDNFYSLKGMRLQMSIPLFEHSNKVPKAESDLSYIDLKIIAYNSKLHIEKKQLYDKSIQLKSSLNEQIKLIDSAQLELNKKSYELGNISLTQFYIDNTGS